MKRSLPLLMVSLAVLPLTGCVELDEALLGSPGYGPHPSRPYYDRGYGYSDHRDYYDDHHHSSSDRSYYGGPHAWYEAGVGIGRKDRREHVSPNYRRHKSQYDGRTEHEFARGYNDGYYGR